MQAASKATSSYDALLELFERLGNFLRRLEIHTKIPLTTTMTDIIVKIMVEVLSVLALAAKQIKGLFGMCTIVYTLPMAQCVIEKSASNKLLENSEVEAVLQRIDRLTEDEARMAVPDVSCGFVGNTKVITEGTQRSHDLLLIVF
jgi:hypothetical protein